jgi:cytoskeleton protein RodZ
MDQTLGVWLRDTREAKGSSIQDAATVTRIRPRFLVMMEDGDFASFPGGELQTRGFLRIVSRYLELSADEVLARYDAEVRGIEPEADREADPPAREAEAVDSSSSQDAWRPLGLRLSARGGRSSAVTIGLIWGAVLIVMIGVGASIAFLLTQGGGGPSAASAAIPTPIPTQRAAASAELVEPTPSATAATVEGVTVSLESTEHVWVRVTVDNRIAHVGFLTPDEIKTWSGDEEILVETGNGAGLEVTVNDRPVGPVGGRGAVVRRAWAPTGEIEPA